MQLLLQVPVDSLTDQKPEMMLSKQLESSLWGGDSACPSAWRAIIPGELCEQWGHLLENYCVNFEYYFVLLLI